MRPIDADSLLYENITDEHGNTYIVVHASQIENAPVIDPAKELLKKINNLERCAFLHPRTFEVSDVFEILRELLSEDEVTHKKEDDISFNLKCDIIEERE